MSLRWTALALTADELAQVAAARSPLHGFDHWPAERRCELGTFWHVAHWLLTGSAEPVDGLEGFLLSGGQPCRELDAGQGPPRFFAPSVVPSLVQLMDQSPRSALVARWDAGLPDELYPFTSHRQASERERVLDGLATLRRLLERAAVAGLGVLVWQR